MLVRHRDEHLDSERGADRRRGWGVIRRAAARLFEPVDIASIVVFRIMFGSMMLGEVWRYFDKVWITGYYVQTRFRFKYFGFAWVEPWPGAGMYVHYAALAVLSAFVIVGFLYRASCALLFAGLAYVFLLDEALYLNHAYLACLFCLLLAVVPAHRARSIDALLRPGIASETAPAWSLWLLRAQMAIVYVYGGLSKLNADWLQGQPMKTWLERRADEPVMGPLFGSGWAPWVFSYGGALFDLIIVPLLLWRRTRVWAFVAAVCFHVLNAHIFSIGIFPWLPLTATLLFLSPSWPRRIHFFFGPGEIPAAPPVRPGRREHATLALVGAYLLVQLVVPLRHYLYPGRVQWTDEGHRFAWHMMLRDKSAVTKFHARPATRKTAGAPDVPGCAPRHQRVPSDATLFPETPRCAATKKPPARGSRGLRSGVESSPPYFAEATAVSSRAPSRRASRSVRLRRSATSARSSSSSACVSHSSS